MRECFPVIELDCCRVLSYVPVKQQQTLITNQLINAPPLPNLGIEIHLTLLKNLNIHFISTILS